MDTLLARELSRPLTALVVTSVFALLAIVLSAIGVYAVMSYDVRERRRELAVRAAVGATAADIFRTVVRRSLITGAVGAAVGLALAASVTHTLRAVLFEVQPLDPSVFLTGAAILFSVVLIAAYFPARRAASTDPAAALRVE